MQMRRVQKEAKEEARRGEGGKTAPEGESREEGLEESRKAGRGRGKTGAKAEAQAERQDERRKAERQAPERARRKIRRGQNKWHDIGDFRQAQGQAGSGRQRFGLGDRFLCYDERQTCPADAGDAIRFLAGFR